MSDELLGLVNSLVEIMDEESAMLSGGAWPPDNGPLAAAKLRLTGALEALIAEQERTDPLWLVTVRDGHGPLADAFARLRDSSAANANLLARQISLSQELLQEIAREAGRLGGTRQQTYARGGQLNRVDGPTPVTLNTRL